MVPSILRPFSPLIRVGFKMYYLYSTMLGQVRLGYGGPYDLQWVPTILRLFGPLIRVGFKIYYRYSTKLG